MIKRKKMRRSVPERKSLESQHQIFRVLLVIAIPLLLIWPSTPFAAGTPGQGALEIHLFEILALNDELTLTQSASASLTRWCKESISSDGQLSASRREVPVKPATASIRSLLGLNQGEPVEYRKVDLSCGDVVLSEADNWYVPGRLPTSVRDTLHQTKAPFGLAVKDLHPVRLHLQSWLHPSIILRGLFPGQPTQGRVQSISSPLFSHRALLVTAAGPISLVEETYQSALIDLTLPHQTQLWRRKGTQGALKP
jgi:chorismate-pyruvate lyase